MPGPTPRWSSPFERNGAEVGMGMGPIRSALWLTVYPKDCRCQLAEPRLSSEICLLIAPMECGRPRNHPLREAESGYGARENVARLEVGQLSKTLLLREQPL